MESSELIPETKSRSSAGESSSSVMGTVATVAQLGVGFATGSQGISDLLGSDVRTSNQI